MTVSCLPHGFCSASLGPKDLQIHCTKDCKSKGFTKEWVTPILGANFNISQKKASLWTLSYS